jgi:hypothetical protein
MNSEHDTEIEDHDKGLAFDLPKLISRRRALGVAGSLTTAALAACGASSSSNSTGSSATATAAADASGEIPDETPGPYPGDGSNGPTS